MEDADYEKRVNHPAHYVEQSAMVEPIELCERLGFNLGNAVKYIVRAGHKGDTVEDLEKARWYLIRAEDPSHAFLPQGAEDDAVTGYLLKLFSERVDMPALGDLLDMEHSCLFERVRALRSGVEDRLDAIQGHAHAS